MCVEFIMTSRSVSFQFFVSHVFLFLPIVSDNLFFIIKFFYHGEYDGVLLRNYYLIHPV